MPVFDHTSPIAAGLASAGNAMQGFQQARQAREQHSASMDEQKVRIAAIAQEAVAARRERIRKRRSDAATVMSLQQQALREDAAAVAGGKAAMRGAATGAAVAGAMLGPVTAGAVRSVMQKASDALPPALQAEMRQTQRLMSQMTPEDARAFMEQRSSEMKARTLAFEQMRLMRDIESAANRGVFGDVSGGADGAQSAGAGTLNNLMGLAQQNPAKARELLQGLLNRHQQERQRQLVRDDALNWATEQLGQAQKNGTNHAGIVEAQGLLADFEVDDNFEPSVFRSKMRAALLKPDVPMVRVFGLDKEVEDRSGWSHGGFLEDMSPRQKSELTSIARFMARQDMIEEGLSESSGDPLDPTVAVSRGLDPVELQRRTEEHLSTLFASNGWRNMGDDEFAYSRAGMPWESQNEFFTAWNDAAQAGVELDQQQLDQAGTLPSWDSTPGDVRLRVAQKIAEHKAQDPSNERGQELFAMISAMGVNPESVDMAAAQEMSGKTELTDAEMQAELDQMKGYPLSDPKDVQRYEKELARRQVQKGADKATAAPEAIAQVAQAAKADGYSGEVVEAKGKGGDATLEVLRRWYEKRGDQEKAASVLRILRARGAPEEWKESELRKLYADALVMAGKTKLDLGRKVPDVNLGGK